MIAITNEHGWTEIRTDKGAIFPIYFRKHMDAVNSMLKIPMNISAKIEKRGRKDKYINISKAMPYMRGWMHLLEYMDNKTLKTNL